MPGASRCGQALHERAGHRPGGRPQRGAVPGQRLACCEEEEDIVACRDMLVPSLQELTGPLFVGPSLMDGEILVRLPFNFTKAISWELPGPQRLQSVCPSLPVTIA